MPDDFIDPYMGKVYSEGTVHDSWEVFTMGIQDLYTHSAGEIMKNDPDYATFMLGVLAVL